MLARHLCALLALCFLALVVSAAEYKGTLEKIDTKSGKISVKVDEKVKDFDIPFNAKVFDSGGKESTGKKRLAIFKTSDDVVVTTEKKKVGDEEKEIVTKFERKTK